MVNCILLALNTPLPKLDKSDLNIRLVSSVNVDYFFFSLAKAAAVISRCVNTGLLFHLWFSIYGFSFDIIPYQVSILLLRGFALCP